MSQVENFVQAQRMMQEVVAAMKEIPFLPSEKPQKHDQFGIERVELLDAGGVETHMKGHPFPYRGFPYYEFVDKIDYIKKLSKGIRSGLYHSTKGWKRILLNLYAKDLCWAELYSYHRFIERFRIKPERMSNAVREVHRAYSIPLPNESQRQKELRERVRDVICMFFECDNAYRFRYQDVAPLANAKMLRKNPKKELIRLIGILQSRERTQEIKDSWTLTKFLVDLFLRDKDARKVVAHCSVQIDSRKVALDVVDKWWCCVRKDYTFGFQQHPEQEDHLFIEYAEITDQYHDDIDRIQQESTSAHEKLQIEQSKAQENWWGGKREQILKEISDKQALIDQEYKARLNEIAAQFQKEMDNKKTEIAQSYMSSEYSKIVKQQTQQRNLLDDQYSKKMTDIEKPYEEQKKRIIELLHGIYPTKILSSDNKDH